MSLSAPDYWQSKGIKALLLYPVSLLFAVLSLLRRVGYRTNLFNSHRLSIPVVIVGNITAGGAGKTPLVIALVEHLKRQGIRPGVISGGYGGSVRGGPPGEVYAGSSPVEVGDESVVIAKRTGVPVVVAKDRVAAAKMLIGHCEILICDDGLQHYALQRDIEIVVIDAQRLLGNGLLLPAGPLRESQKRLESVDLVVHSGKDRGQPGYELLADAVVNLETGTNIALSELAGEQVHAVAAIAYPDKFFSLLRSHGIDIIEHRFPDHYAFKVEDLRFNDDRPIVMTEKDQVKCQEFANDNMWFLSVSAVVDTDILESFDRLLISKGVLIPGDRT